MGKERKPKMLSKDILMKDFGETKYKASKVCNSLGVPDRYCITQAIIKSQFIRGIQIDAIYKSRKSDQIPVFLRMSEDA